MKDKETSVSWVGGIYRKIEALYLEADDMIRQEAHDFMENHLQPVSANVKQLYEDLVRDVQVPQSSSDESTEVAQPDLVLNETTDSFTNVSFDVADENKKENQLDFPKEEKDFGKSDVTKTELSSLQNEGSKSSFEESDSRGDSEPSEDLSDELFVSVSSLDVQSLVAVDLGNSSEDEITAGNLDHCNNEASSSISRSAVKLEESCILVNDDEDYVLSRREKRHWYRKKNWKQPVLALASKSMKQKQSHSLCPSAVACLETREHEEAAFSPPIADENSESDWEIV